MSPDERRAALDQIASEVRACAGCRLHETRTRAVPGEGDRTGAAGDDLGGAMALDETGQPALQPRRAHLEQARPGSSAQCLLTR